MQSFAKILKNLKRIDQSQIGAIDDTIPYLCRHSQKLPINKVFSSNQWYWQAIPTCEIEKINLAIIMFIKHVDYDIHIHGVISAITNRNVKLIGYCVGLMINKILFLNEKYNSKNFDVNEIWSKLSTGGEIYVGNNIAPGSNDLFAYFNLLNCSYYCVF